MDSLILAGQGRRASILPGAVQLPMFSADFSSTLFSPSLQASVAVSVDALSLASMVNQSLWAGQVSIAADLLSLVGLPIDIAIIPGEVAMPVDTLALASALRRLVPNWPLPFVVMPASVVVGNSGRSFPLAALVGAYALSRPRHVQTGSEGEHPPSPVSAGAIGERKPSPIQ